VARIPDALNPFFLAPPPEASSAKNHVTQNEKFQAYAILLSELDVIAHVL
jgi:hypothetical protein